MAIVLVIDTSVWASAFLNPGGHPARLVAACRAGTASIVSSLPLLQELADVLTRPRIMQIRRTTRAEADLFVAGVGAVARLVPVSGHLRLCRDPEDDLLLETAIAGGATCVVSRDEDIARDPALADELRRRAIRPITVQQALDLLRNLDAAGEADV